MLSGQRPLKSSQFLYSRMFLDISRGFAWQAPPGNDFWRAHQQYALQRARDASLQEPERRARAHVAARSALEARTEPLEAQNEA